MTPYEFEKKANKCEWALDRLDAYLDGDLSAEESSSMQIHLEKCAACSGELELAEATQTAIRNLPEQQCPDAVTAAVMEHIASEASPGRPVLSWWNALLRWRPLRPAAIAAALVLVVSMSILIDHRREPAVPPLVEGNDTLEYTPEQIALAEAEVKWTFAYINQTFHRAGVTVRDKAIYPHVVVPVKQAIETAGDGK